MTQDLRERVARALLVSFYARDAWNSVVEAERETFRHHADAALTVALEEAARMADDEACHWEDTGSAPSDFGNAGRNDAARTIAAAIREMIPKGA